MNIIRVSTDLKISIHEFPEGNISEQNNFLHELIGNDCEIYEHVMPNRLYKDLKMKNKPTKIPGQCVSMLIDEEGRCKEHQVFNPIASYIYETDIHRQPIVGNVLFVGEKWGGDGIDFCGIEEKYLRLLYRELRNMALAFRATMEVLK